jgi:hypothetical protein
MDPMNDSCFLPDLPAFQAWADQVDTWRSRRSLWLMDLDCRSVEVTEGGAVTIHPDEHGSTKWFVDLVVGRHPGRSGRVPTTTEPDR